MKNLRWTNKMSGECGYVKSVAYKKGHFVNTFSRDEAKKYRTENEAKKDIAVLESFGECENNIIEVIDVMECR